MSPRDTHGCVEGRGVSVPDWPRGCSSSFTCEYVRPGACVTAGAVWWTGYGGSMSRASSTSLAEACGGRADAQSRAPREGASGVSPRRRDPRRNPPRSLGPGHARCRGECRPLCERRRFSGCGVPGRRRRRSGVGSCLAARGGGGRSLLEPPPRGAAPGSLPTGGLGPDSVSIFRRNDKSTVSEGAAPADIVPEGLVHCLVGLSTPLTFRTSWHTCARRPVAGVPGFAQVTLMVTVSFSVILIGVTQ